MSDRTWIGSWFRRGQVPKGYEGPAAVGAGIQLFESLTSEQCDCYSPGTCEHAGQVVASQAGAWLAAMDELSADPESADRKAMLLLLEEAREIVESSRAVLL